MYLTWFKRGSCLTIFCSPGFYLRTTTSLRKKEQMAMLRIKVCMNIIFIVSDIYAHFLIRNYGLWLSLWYRQIVLTLFAPKNVWNIWFSSLVPFARTWWLLFQKRIDPTKFDIYVFITVVGFTTTCARSTYHYYSYEFKFRSWRCVLDMTSCDKVCQWLAAGRWFSQGTPVSFTNKAYLPLFPYLEYINNSLRP
jgi:hypothetical protein